MTMASDTLSISKDLRAAGFDEHQAEVLATHMAATPDNLVTKEHLALELSRLMVKLGGGLAVATGLILAGMAIATAVLLNQLG